LMLENAIYSVITAEGCAAILWKTAEAKDKAAAALRITAPDLQALGVVDEVIPEPTGGAHEDWDAAADALKEVLTRHVEELVAMDEDEVRRTRWDKYRRLGEWQEQSDVDAPAPPVAEQGA
ncbi:MAG: acetyl-CoA carboxylase carboxyl transferase subunit alpha, partial [Gemmatimonadota bacterium]